jgi:hypothetical protein
MSYFNLDFNPKMARSLVHTLNRKYKGARLAEVAAPDAGGKLLVWARNPDEVNEHIYNALFDLIFNRNRCGAAVDNPACIYCGYRTESRGRNSSGTRGWRCLNVECRHSFVLERSFRGGINHPSQSKKPEFHQLVFVQGKTLREAADILGISHGAASNWFEKMAAINGGTDKLCPCGKPLRHRGSCKFRLNYKKLRQHKETRESLGEITRRQGTVGSAA